MNEGNWKNAWRAVGATPPADLLAELLARYAEPHRHYHTRQHLDECFAALEPAATLAERPAEIQIAIWFHDAIYDPQAHDNEEASAQWAHAALLAGGATAETAERVRQLILATKHTAPPSDADARLLVDVDLAILGADEPRFAEYERQIRDEYSWVAEPAFRAGRTRVLEAFLRRTNIYNTPAFRDRLEARARRNLTASLARLA